MKILLCTPYLDSPDVVSGGINMWARNILGWYKTLGSDLEIIPVSFDRKFHVSTKSSVFIRIIYGIKDYFHPIRETWQHLRNGRYDVLHLCTSAQLSLYKDLFLLRMAERHYTKTVIHFHFGRIPELMVKKNWEYRILMKVCRKADSIVVMDLQSEKVLRSAGFDNVRYLPNPLSMEIIEQVGAMDGTTERQEKKILFVGNVIRTKGVVELVGACRELDEVKLHIVGNQNPSVRREMEELAAVKADGVWLKFCGALPHHEVLREMMSASVFAFPSYTEGFPNVILEAMACGCPIVASSAGAIPEMLAIGSGNECGICIEPKNVGGLASALEKMLSDPDFAAHCAGNAKTRVNGQYAVPQVWNMLTKIWENI